MTLEQTLVAPAPQDLSPARENARTGDAALISQARTLVKDLFPPSATIYWTDLVASLLVGYVGFYLTHRSDLPVLARCISFVLAGLAFYRAALFTHELVHLGPGFKSYRVFWNVFCGIPLLIPSFLYYTHLEHHRPSHYGTHDDGEYLPLARGPLRGILLMLLGGLPVPAIAVVRFLVLSPLSWFIPPLRRIVHTYASAMVIDVAYARPAPSPKQWRVWRVQEAVCFLYLLLVAVFLAKGWLAVSWVVEAYAAAVVIMTINTVRTLAAHRYRHLPDEPHSLTEQLLDSINHPNLPLVTEIWAPVGLRFHALHHLMPGLPYHALPEAHRRLMASLPADSPYRQTNSPGLWLSLSQLWREASAASRSRAALNPS